MELNGFAVSEPLFGKKLSTDLMGSYEALTLTENHKYRQSGLGIIRKHTPAEQIVRAQSLQAELIEINELPIRNDLLPMGKEALHKR
ncbi:hypothetical protein PRJBM_01351 [Bartonella henselae]|nr:hypothetical protein Q654_01362 [Bartonella henselae JK 50]ETS07454.1 hypothetical protein Q655_01313 [Bartonella henselae JK 51]CDO40585.1 hypothetical protein PRJBM_01222 [Bartonella henselae]ETS08360.1 hypothetical protein Q654_01236 [Bartonella henselae JK 50]ETS08909.1 hypothetical protein Q655_01190 [Bartonella henselae JK 51]